MKKIKFLLINMLMLAMILPAIPVESSNHTATVFNPDTGHRKVVDIGDPHAFDGGYLLEVAYGYEKLPDNLLGYSVVTNYKTTLSASMSSTQSTIPVVSVTTTDSTTLTMGLLGAKVFLTVEPGGSKMEIIMCTGISGTSFTGCTRGLAFSGTSTAAVAANRKTHSAGSVVVMSNVHYTMDEVVDKDSAETIAGVKTFSSIPLLPASDPTTANQATRKQYVDNTVNQGAATSSETVAGIGQVATQAEQASSTFVSAAPTFLSTKYASSTPASRYVVVGNTSSLIDPTWYQSNDQTFSGDNTYTGTNGFSATTTLNNAVGSFFGGTGSDGALLTTGTTTIDADSANVVVKNYTSINIPSGTGVTLSNAATDGTVLILKSQGDCTIAGGIDMEGFGGAGGAGGAGAAAGGAGNANGVVGTAGGLILDASADHFGDKGDTDGTAGTAGAIYTLKQLYTTPDDFRLTRRSMVLTPGSGGGGGGGGDAAVGGGTGGAGGTGGGGGGVVIIECGGYLTFTGFIKVDGADGADGAAAAGGASGAAGGGGGSGGAAGMALVLYNNLATSTGSIYATGGAGGAGGQGKLAESAQGGGGAGGAGGYSAAGGAGGAGGIDAGNGAAGSNAGGVGAGGGGGGGCGRAASSPGTGGTAGANDSTQYLITQNLYF